MEFKIINVKLDYDAIPLETKKALSSQLMARNYDETTFLLSRRIHIRRPDNGVLSKF